MADDKSDATQIKNQQREIWNASAAGWKKGWERMERAGQVVADRLADLAGVKNGDRVLDIATGIGEPAITVARRVGPAGHVVATDQSAGMLAAGRERAAALNLKNIEFIEADAEAIDFPEASFDAVTCRWGLMFLPNLGAALARIQRVLKPGGRFATSVWAAAPKVPLITLGDEKVRRIANLPPPPPGSLGPLSLADTGKLSRALTEAGFADVGIEPLTVSFDFSSDDDFMQFRLDLSAQFRAMFTVQPPATQAEIRKAIAEDLERYRGTDGRIRIDNEAICLVARR
jgi:SAM-dependent methyltransferase